LTAGRPITPISTICHSERQHDQTGGARKFCRRFRVVTPVGLRPPCVTTRKRHPATAPAEIHLSRAGTCPDKPGRLCSTMPWPEKTPPPDRIRSSEGAGIRWWQ
jgi:hypothetical protein